MADLERSLGRGVGRETGRGGKQTVRKHAHAPQPLNIDRAQRNPFPDCGGEGMAVIGVDGRIVSHGMVDGCAGCEGARDYCMGEYMVSRA